MSDQGKSSDWLDATKMSQEALALAKQASAVNRAHVHVTMLILATLAKTAPREAIDQVISELERVRDLTGPAGVAAGEVFATALSTLERFVRKG